MALDRGVVISRMLRDGASPQFELKSLYREGGAEEVLRPDKEVPVSVCPPGLPDRNLALYIRFKCKCWQHVTGQNSPAWPPLWED